MKKKLPLILISLTLIFASFKENRILAQSPMNITTCSDSAAVIALVDTVLLGGVPAYAKQNIKFYGNPQSVGYYSNADFLGYETSTGIVLSTGKVSDIASSNMCSSTGISTVMGGIIDPDLNILANNISHDGCVVEFSFKPNADFINLDLIFASEEYHSYVFQMSNDVVGVFLSGPGINGPYTNNAINIAEVPNTTLPICIDNINIGNHPGICETPDGCTNCEFFNSNTDPTQPIFNRFPFNGYTTPIEVSHTVSQCQWYNVKIVIGDVMDGVNDSGVFFEKNTVDVGNIMVDLNLPDTESEYLVEGCGEAYINFSLSQPLSYDYTINYELDGSAIFDVDYVTNSNYFDTVVISAGELSDSISFGALYDGNEEPIEDIQVIYQAEMCNPFIIDTAFVYISDPLESNQLDIDISDSTYCYSTDLIATPGFDSYEWSTGETTSTITVFGEGEYGVTAFDSVGCPVIKSREVPPPQQPFNHEEICLVFTDESTEKNVIIVEKTYNVNTDSILYYSMNSDSIYEKIGSQQFNETWEFVDEDIVPTSSMIYRINLKDSCGNLSVLSDYHKTIWLQSNVINGDVILNWNPYEGFYYSEFEVYRKVIDEDFTLIGTTPNNVLTFTDYSAPIGDLSYQIRVMPDPDTVCNPYKGIYSRSVSNTINITTVGIHDFHSDYFKTYPNPTNGLFTLENKYSGIFSIAILDSYGRQLTYTEYPRALNKLSIDISTCKLGVYTVLINNSYALKVLRY